MERNIFGGLAALLAVSALTVEAQAAPAPPAYVAYDTQPIAGENAGANGINNLGGASSAVLWPVKNSHGLVVGVSETSAVDPLTEEGFSCGAFLDLHGHTCLP